MAATKRITAPTPIGASKVGRSTIAAPAAPAFVINELDEFAMGVSQEQVEYIRRNMSKETYEGVAGAPEPVAKENNLAYVAWLLRLDCKIRYEIATMMMMTSKHHKGEQ